MKIFKTPSAILGILIFILFIIVINPRSDGKPKILTPCTIYLIARDATFDTKLTVKDVTASCGRKVTVNHPNVDVCITEWIKITKKTIVFNQLKEHDLRVVMDIGQDTIAFSNSGKTGCINGRYCEFTKEVEDFFKKYIDVLRGS